MYVAPLVAYLCHEDCEDTGGVFEVCVAIHVMGCGVCVMSLVMNMFVCILLQCAGGWAGKGEVKYAM